MARLPRTALTGCVHHLVQHGHDGQPYARDEADRQRFVQLLAEVALEEGVRVHAYLLWHSELHLLATPTRDGALSRWMQGASRRYALGYNRRHARRGGLWEGRFAAAPLQEGAAYWTALIGMATLPVREGGLDSATAWPWSSAAHHVGTRSERWLVDHPQQWQLGNTPFEREAACQRLMLEGVSSTVWDAHLRLVRRGYPVGDASFQAQVAQATGHAATPRPRGRPRKLARGERTPD